MIDTNNAVRMDCSVVEWRAKASIECAPFAFPLPTAAPAHVFRRRLRFWLGQVPLAWILAELTGLGALGVFISVPVSFSVLALWSAVLFKRGKWKLQKV